VRCVEHAVGGLKASLVWRVLEIGGQAACQRIALAHVEWTDPHSFTRRTRCMHVHCSVRCVDHAVGGLKASLVWRVHEIGGREMSPSTRSNLVAHTTNV